MLKSTISAVCFGVMMLTGSLSGAADELFSDVPINSVFAPPGAQPGAPRTAPTAAPSERPSEGPAGGDAIIDAMRSAGFEPKRLSELVVSTKVQADKWSFPVLVSTSEENGDITIALLLSVVKYEQQLPAEKLLELLSASREHTPAYFAYSSKRKRIELYRTLQQRNPSAEAFKTEIQRLAQIAKATESLWNMVTTPAVAAKPTTAPSLIGKWTAAKTDKEAFALQLESNGKYILVHVNQGKKNRSTGTFALTEQLLTLTGDDGTKISGSIASPTQQQFQFAPQGTSARPLTFKRAT